MGKLVDKQIRTWITNNVRFDCKSDGDRLYIRYRDTDKKPVWFMRFKIGGIEQKLILGHYPDLSIAAARKEAGDHSATIRQGGNPAADRREKKQARVAEAIAAKSAQTVKDLVDEYFRRKVDGKLKQSSIESKKCVIDKHLLPAIGRLKIKEVQPMHISKLLNDIVDTGSRVSANKVLSYSKQIFDYAVIRQIIPSNPAAAFKRGDAGGEEKSRDRYLTHEELSLLFKSMRECPGFNRNNFIATKLLLLFGCRKNELLYAKRSDFALGAAIWQMNPENKTESPIDIPIVPAAMELLNELLAHQIDRCEYLFPARAGNGHVNHSYINKALDKVIGLMGDIKPFTVHDFRATLRTHITSKSIGVDRFVAERCLNHKIPGMEGVYDRGDYIDERRAALELWAAFLETCETGKAWNVTPIRKAAV